MIWLILVIVALMGIIVFQYQSNRSRSANLQHMHQKLQRIVQDQTGEKLLVVTDDRELRALLIEMNELLEYTRKTVADYTQTEQSTKKMLSNMSHDLKTPLTVILGYIEMIHMDTQMCAEERAAVLAKVYQKTLDMLDLLYKFFDLSKLESGDQHIPMTRIQLDEVCRHNMLAFYEILTAKGIDVRIQIPDEGVFVLGNEEALNRILNNLISNALQHGGDGRTIGLTLKTINEYAVVEVWDEGKGIREQHQDRIFERLYTLDDSRNKSYPNSGLGLTITKRLVTIMGGTISLTSKPHEKTVFSVRLSQIR